jgi:CRP/FNR family cyclic AMP-dependent transcriptional regulator
MDETNLWYLENFSMLSPLSAGEIIELERRTVFWEVKKGQAIYFPGDTADNLYMLKRGKVKISRRSAKGKEVIMAILGPGEIFGELALTGQDSREEVASAVEDAILCSMRVDQFENVMINNPKFHLQITKLIGDRLSNFERRMERLIFKSAEQRIRCFVRELAEEHGRVILYNP